MGQFSHGFLNGKGIMYYKNDKFKYEGDFKNGIMEGNGKLINEDGSYYEWQFLNKYKHGEGKLFYKDGTIIYDGLYENNEPKGKRKGKLNCEYGCYYIGESMDGEKHGKGI